MFYGLMQKQFYLNNQVATIEGMTSRQILSLTDKGVVTPAKEARGAGSKRGYDYINLIEFGICKRLFEMGHGIQSVKSILSDLREQRLIKEWVIDEKKLFKRYYQMAGGVFTMLPSKDTAKAITRVKALERSFHEMFYTEPMLTKKRTGVLFYFFGGVLNRRSIIVPQTNFTKFQKLLGALKQIYGMLLDQEAVIVLNIGKIKNEIDEASELCDLT